MDPSLIRQLVAIFCLSLSFLIKPSTAEIEICGNYVAYSVTSRRNATGYRELSSDLAVQDKAAPDVRLELQQKSCVVEGIRHLRINTFIGLPERRLPPPGYEFVPNLGWYRLYYQKPLTWEEARLACEAEGAHLAVLNSQQEADALKGIFARAPANIPGATYHHVAIIGFTDLVEGKYYTIFGDTLHQAGYAVWGNDQPNNAGGSKDPDADCGGIERTGKLNDLPCRSINAYFCEFPV